MIKTENNIMVKVKDVSMRFNLGIEKSFSYNDYITGDIKIKIL